MTHAAVTFALQPCAIARGERWRTVGRSQLG